MQAHTPTQKHQALLWKEPAIDSQTASVYRCKYSADVERITTVLYDSTSRDRRYLPVLSVPPTTDQLLPCLPTCKGKNACPRDTDRQRGSVPPPYFGTSVQAGGGLMDRPGQFATTALLDVAALFLHAFALLCQGIFSECMVGLNRWVGCPVEEEECRSTCITERTLISCICSCGAFLQAVTFGMSTDIHGAQRKEAYLQT